MLNAVIQGNMEEHIAQMMEHIEKLKAIEEELITKNCLLISLPDK